MNSMPETPKNQTLLLKDRRRLEVDSVTDVVSFDEGAVVLRTALGVLHIEGSELHITRLDLDKGALALEGRIGAFYYIDKREDAKGGFFSRMVK